MSLEKLDTSKETINLNLPNSVIEWLDERAKTETFGNRSMAAAQAFRKLARLEQAEDEGRLSIKKA